MIFRNAQGLTLGLGRQAGAQVGTLESVLQSPSLLQDLEILSTQLGLVTGLRVSGQSVMCSDSGCNMQMFAANAHVEGHRGMAIPLAQQQTVALDYDTTLAAVNTTISAGVNLRPIRPENVIPVNDLGRALNYVFGMGEVAIPIGAGAALNATARRDCVLGLLTLTPSGVPEDVTVQSITVNNIELMAGPIGPAGECSIHHFEAQATDDDGNTIGYPVRSNDQVQINLWNYNAAIVNAYGGIYVLPIDPEQG
ncbi:MAG: hypothetical protein GY772_28875 [bacterium]|nr:hypothetical protein [bacterium]